MKESKAKHTADEKQEGNKNKHNAIEDIFRSAKKDKRDKKIAKKVQNNSL